MKVRCNQHGLFRSILVEKANKVFRFFRCAPPHIDLFVFHELGPTGLAEIQLSTLNLLVDHRQDRSGDQVPVLGQVKRNHRLNVRLELPAIIHKSQVLVVVHLDWDRYQIGQGLVNSWARLTSPLSSPVVSFSADKAPVGTASNTMSDDISRIVLFILHPYFRSKTAFQEASQ